MDPLKNKFKAFTFKFYHITLRHDLQYVTSKFEEFLDDPDLGIKDWFYDYDAHIGIHFNGILRSTSYKNLYKTYSAKDTKKEGVFLSMQDLGSTLDYNKWMFYCYMRKEVNWRRFLPESPPSPKIVF